LKKNKKRFGKSKNFTYLCTTKEIDNDSDTNLKKKIKKDLVNQKTLPIFVKQIGRVRNVL
jgi:hypothetical protein